MGGGFGQGQILGFGEGGGGVGVEAAGVFAARAEDGGEEIGRDFVVLRVGFRGGDRDGVGVHGAGEILLQRGGQAAQLAGGAADEGGDAGAGERIRQGQAFHGGGGGGDEGHCLSPVSATGARAG